MKNVQDTSKSLEVLSEAIQTESQKKGKATLYQIAKEGKTFKIIEFVKRENQVNETLKLNWIAFTFSSDLLGEDVIMEVNNAAHAHAQECVQLAHPLHITLSQIIIYCDYMDTLAL